MNKFWFLILIIITLISCEKHNADEIKKLLNSDDASEIIKGCSLLNGGKDTIFVKYLFKNMDDTRISHEAQFYGISVFEAKIKTLKRISGLIPPNEMSYKYDSTNVAFYKDWALKHGFINR